MVGLSVPRAMRWVARVRRSTARGRGVVRARAACSLDNAAPVYLRLLLACACWRQY